MPESGKISAIAPDNVRSIRSRSPACGTATSFGRLGLTDARYRRESVPEDDNVDVYANPGERSAELVQRARPIDDREGPAILEHSGLQLALGVPSPAEVLSPKKTVPPGRTAVATVCRNEWSRSSGILQSQKNPTQLSHRLAGCQRNRSATM